MTMTTTQIDRLRSLHAGYDKLKALPLTPQNGLSRILTRRRLLADCFRLERRLIERVHAMTAPEFEALTALFEDLCRSKTGLNCSCGACFSRREVGVKRG